MVSLEILANMNENKNEHKFLKLDSYGNNITVINKTEKAATKDEIRYLQNMCQVPDCYVEFLTICNGARLFDYEGIDGLQLLGTREVLQYTKYVQNTFEEEWDERIIIFAKIIGEDNYLGFRVSENNQYVILDCYFEEGPDNWRIIEGSFDDFLSKYLLSGGNKFWIE